MSSVIALWFIYNIEVQKELRNLCIRVVPFELWVHLGQFEEERNVWAVANAISIEAATKLPGKVNLSRNTNWTYRSSI